MSNVWQVQEAKARFSEMLETSLFRGGRKLLPNGVWRLRFLCQSNSGGEWRV